MSRIIKNATQEYDLDGSRTDFPITFDLYNEEALSAGQVSPYIRAIRIDLTGEEFDVTNLISMPDKNTVRISPAIGQTGETLRLVSNPIGVGTVAPLGRWDYSPVDGVNLSRQNIGNALYQLQLYCEALTDTYATWVENYGETTQSSPGYSFVLDGSEEYELEGIDKEVNANSLTVLINGSQLHPQDYTTRLDEYTGNLFVDLGANDPGVGFLYVKVGNQNNLAANLNPGDVDNTALADGSVTIEKLNISGNPYEVLGLDDEAEFGLQSLTPEYISGLLAFIQAITINSMASPDGTLDLNSQRISNLAAPVNANDAARKADIDAIGTFVPGSVVAKVDLDTGTNTISLDTWYVPSQTQACEVRISGRNGARIQEADDVSGANAQSLFLLDNSADDSGATFTLAPGQAWRWTQGGTLRYVTYKFLG